ncbi:hypothetical protein OC842_003903 [Tilletia horrida]|uniref:Uncharacterized protein n=1 Tax=Tilletia horrida TaxID=155126 RepID=A0AAN6GD90_9BASI|nr:hypothetical protein OC842_003903 [Tilletia horrida]
MFGRQSYERTVTEAANILGQPVEHVSLWHHGDGNGSNTSLHCRIHPSAWSSLPHDAPVYAKLDKPPKPKSKATDAPATTQHPGKKQKATSQSVAGASPASKKVRPNSTPSNARASASGSEGKAGSGGKRSQGAQSQQGQARQSPRNAHSASSAKKQQPAKEHQQGSVKDTASSRPRPEKRKHKEVSTASGGDGAAVEQGAERAIANAESQEEEGSIPRYEGHRILGKQSRFASVPGAGGPGSSPRASTSQDTLDGSSSESSLSTTSTDSELSSTSSATSSTSPVLSSAGDSRRTQRADQSQSKKNGASRRLDDDQDDFELVAVHSPAYRAARAGSPVSLSSDSDRNSERDELISDNEEASDRNSSVTTVQTVPEDADDELGESDWSETFKFPKRSSAKHWSPKEHVLFMDKLRIECEPLTHHLSGAERSVFFSKFEHKYRSLFNSRTAHSFYNRIAGMRKIARAEGKNLPKQVCYLFRPDKDASLAPSQPSTSRSQSAQSRLSRGASASSRSSASASPMPTGPSRSQQSGRASTPFSTAPSTSRSKTATGSSQRQASSQTVRKRESTSTLNGSERKRRRSSARSSFSYS